MKTLYTLIYFFMLLQISNAQTILTCRTYGSPSASQMADVGYDFNNSPVEYDGCQMIPAIIIAVIDSGTCEPWNTCDRNFGQANTFTPNGPCGPGVTGTGSCRNRTENYFIFRFNDSTQMAAMAAMLNSVPAGYYILAYTWFTYPYSQVPVFTNAFQNLGGQLINFLADSYPYIFFIQKGNPGSLIETLATTANSQITLTATLNCTSIGIDEMENYAFELFPNPVSQNLILRLENISDFKCAVINITGQIVIEQTDSFIDVSMLAPGIYCVNLFSGEKKFTSRFIKE
jgi:hypothetical protein